MILVEELIALYLLGKLIIGTPELIEKSKSFENTEKWVSILLVINDLILIEEFIALYLSGKLIIGTPELIEKSKSFEDAEKWTCHGAVYSRNATFLFFAER